MSNKKVNNEEKNEKNEILINKMYTGRYLKDNVGHEVINFYKNDNGDCYVYVMPYGGISKNHVSNVKWIFLTGAKETIKIKNRYYSALEILALREVESIALKNEILGDFRKKQKNEKKEHYKKFCEKWEKEHKAQIKKNIKYDGVEVGKIFKDNQGDSTSIYVTYKVKNEIRRPKKKMYFVKTSDNKKIKETDAIYIPIESKELPGSSCKSYIIPEKEESKNNKNKISDYEAVKDYIDDKYWVKSEAKKVQEIDKSEYEKESCFFEKMGKENDETAYTNMLYYFFNKDKIFNDFIKFVNKNNKIKLEKDDNYIIQKEKFVLYKDNKEKKKKRGRMDLVAYGHDNIIIIENKIKSNLNGKQSDNTTQITTYYEAIKKREKELFKNEEINKERTIKILILVPNYKKREIEKEIQNEAKEISKDIIEIVTYEELYNFFNSIKKKENDLEEFIKALKLHTYESFREKFEEETLRKFKMKIDKAKNKQK